MLVAWDVNIDLLRNPEDQEFIYNFLIRKRHTWGYIIYADV